MIAKHSLGKNYYELRALLTLKSLFPQCYGQLLHKDKPDLIDIDNDSGVEVVRVIDTRREEYASFFTNHLANKKISDVPLKQIKCFEEGQNRILTKSGFSAEPADEIIGYLPPAIWHSTTNLKRAIAKKVDYIDKTSWLVKKLALYIFTDSFCDYDKHEIDELTWHMYKMQEFKENKFFKLYVDDCGWFYSCDLSTCETMFYDTHAILESVCKAAKSIAMGDLL